MGDKIKAAKRQDWSYSAKPRVGILSWCSLIFMNGRQKRIPKDWTKTLRRIV